MPVFYDEKSKIGDRSKRQTTKQKWQNTWFDFVAINVRPPDPCELEEAPSN